ncbi:unnamed protein product [Spirodela intermedia]|uniref:Tubby C-terminal domain-containing protein n=1 Tax=Spirodela intermedia TaxID=51605 RepID=A0A7I8J019_SPIIN|nr:unnamed protein product [Spirodela intermedia]CAA6663477.1 unnamed protein product [Spirodela intermedia]
MPFKSIIQDMKGEMGSISGRGFDVKFISFSMRSRSHRAVVHDGPAPSPPVDALKQSCWANMPPELLRDVLMRIEASQSSWPYRKNVVICAAVCRNWREITKEIVKAPEVSGRLTFPISLKQPGPRNFPLQCFIRRFGATQTYHLYLGLTEALSDAGKFLLAARRCRHPTYTDYIISLDANNISKGSTTYIGKLRSNFLGTKFTVHDGMPLHAGAMVTKSHSSRFSSKQVSPSRLASGNYPVVHIAYDVNVMGPRGPRRMQCTMDCIPSSAMEPGGAAPPQLTSPPPPLVLQNKSPRWHEQLQCWCLNFRGRVTVASVKNFQLVASTDDGRGRQEEDDDDVLLQFGKVGKDLFTMDFRYPLSAFQAFAICLSSFDTKISCE